jgi:hypothetical protein
MSIRLGTTIATDGLRLRSWWVLSAFFAAGVVITGLLERSREPAFAADRTLLGATFGVALPIFCYALFGVVHRSAPTLVLFEPLARHGANRRALSLGLFATLAAVTAGAGALFGIIAVFAARGTGDARLASDALACTWSGASIGVAYVGMFAAGSLWGRNGRLVLFIVDWLLGSGTGLLALPWPRGHARNLLGGEAVLELSQGSALLLLWLIGALGVAIFARRVPP